MTTAPTSPVYRLDRFTVPTGARGEFLARVQPSHDVLRVSRASCAMSCRNAPLKTRPRP
ncbi:hypothetical protein [Deinococcus sp.]|uniref:hypothetical protein n=1 Tax=Deinococcus sp. TaxID=47478 RepID=UPI002869993E|nr:hypothetical protein [Deinococcus sp.]